MNTRTAAQRQSRAQQQPPAQQQSRAQQQPPAQSQSRAQQQPPAQSQSRAQQQPPAQSRAPAQELFSVGEAAARVGLTTYTLRWYEQEGLVEPVGRDSAGRRRYTQQNLDWLILLTRLRRTGMPVRDMRRYAELARQGDGTIGARRRLFERHRDRVLGRIAELEEDLKVLDYKIDLYGQLEREL